MHFSYNTSPMVCAIRIDGELENGIIRDVKFTGGCEGNLLAISKLVKGMKAEAVIALLKGNRCGDKPTSCADQLALALEKALQDNR